MKFDDLVFPSVERVALSLSGGLDSTTLAYCLAKQYGGSNVYALSFYYKQKQSIELEKAKITCSKLGINHRVIDISFLGDMVGNVTSNIQGSDIQVPTIQDVLGDPQPKTYIPFRNMLFSTMLLSFAEAQDCGAIALGIQSVDLYSYWDTSAEFVSRMQSVAELNRDKFIQLFTPFVELNKIDEINIGREIGVDFGDTLTCYNPDESGHACGVCPTCSDRIAAFAKCGIIDPIPYQITIPWDNLIK